jgi:hypothetical protein
LLIMVEGSNAANGIDIVGSGREVLGLVIRSAAAGPASSSDTALGT